MSPVRGIPTSRAYWELKAEQVLNRVFDPEKPIEVEVCDTPAAFSDAGSIPVELHDLPPTAVSNAASSDPAAFKPAAFNPPASRPAAAKQPTSKPTQASAKRHPPRPGKALQRLADQVGRQPSLLLAGASVTVMVVAGMALAVLGLWNQSQQAIRQERNMLLIERLRTMGPGTTPAQANEPAQTAAAAVGAGENGALPPPPPGEPWMEELATLPASSAPAADVLKVPVNSRITVRHPLPPAQQAALGAAPRMVAVIVAVVVTLPSLWEWCRCQGKAAQQSFSWAVALPAPPWARASAAAAGDCAQPVVIRRSLKRAGSSAASASAAAFKR